MVSTIALVVIGCPGLPAASERGLETEAQRETTAMRQARNDTKTNVKCDGSKVWIEGVPREEVDGGPLGMLRGLRLLLKQRGDETSMDDLMVYSGDAFNLAYATKWQFMGYMAVPTDIVANVLTAYGYDGGLRHTDPMPEDEDAQRRVTAQVVKTLQEQIASGRPVLVGGCSDGGCYPWTVVVGYDRDEHELCHIGVGEPYRWTKIRGIDIPLNDREKGEFWNAQTRGRAMPGFAGGWTTNTHVILGDRTSKPDPRTRTLTALRRAVELHHAPSHDTGWDITFHFGSGAYEAWADALHELDYPADTTKPVPKHLWDLYRLDEMARMPACIRNGRTIAARFCEAAAKMLPAAQQHLLASAAGYREEVAIAEQSFSVFLNGKEDDWKAWLSDESKREAGVAAIRRMLEKEKVAIAEIERALAAEGVTVDLPEAGDTSTRVLDNVERVFNGLFEQWEKGKGAPWSERSDSYMYLTCMRVAGWDVDYADVITLSGYGPSFGYSQEKWGAHYFPPPGRVKRIGDATGFGFLWEQKKTPEDYWQSLRQTIDSGRPVYGPYMEGVLFIGYRDAERAEERQVRPLARVFVEPGSWWTWEQFTDWHKKHSDGGWFGRHTGKVKTIPASDSAVDVLRLIVQMATDDPRSHYPRFEGVTWGLPGMLAYADDLANMSKSGAKEEEGGYFQGGWRGCHNIYPQMSGRPAAATYLKRVAPLFEGEATRHILAAADQYGEATEAWREFERQLGRPLGDEHGRAWQDAQHRKAGAVAVRKAHDHEKVAVAEIRLALETLR